MAEPVSMEAYSAALDEIWRLRRALAYEAAVVKAHIDYKTFPKTRRAVAEEQIERMRTAACGQAEVAYAGTSHLSMKVTMREAGMPPTLTRAAWEANLHTKGGES